MIVRVLNEGQYRIDDADLVELNTFDDALEKAVAGGDEAQIRATLRALHDALRRMGTPVPDGDLEDSDLILPGPDASLDDLREALGSEGLLPG